MIYAKLKFTRHLWPAWPAAIFSQISAPISECKQTPINANSKAISSHPKSIRSKRWLVSMYCILINNCFLDYAKNTRIRGLKTEFDPAAFWQVRWPETVSWKTTIMSHFKLFSSACTPHYSILLRFLYLYPVKIITFVVLFTSNNTEIIRN